MDSNFNDKIKAYLSTEVKFIITIITIFGGVVAPYYAMRQDIALIQKDISNINANHEVHIQDIVQELKEMKTAELNQNDKIIQLQQDIIRLSK